MAHPLASTGRIVDGGRRELLVAGVLAAVLVVLRCFVPAYYEGYYFDSDQAIVGLMAKHLADFKTFPLFYYGLNYLLGVQAWIIAPLFWIARPSVPVMRLPLVILNIVVAVWLIRAIARHLRLRPALAFVAALPFVAPTPAVSAHLLQLAGASIEPFVYVLLLWRLRNQPMAFGALLAVAYLHREFTVFALPALGLVEASRADFWSRPTLARYSRIALGFAAVWLVVDDLRMHLSGTPLGANVASLGNQLCLTPDQLPPRICALLTQALPSQYGAVRLPVATFGMNTPVVAGSAIVGWLVGAALLAIVMRVVINRRAARDDDEVDRRLGMYLMWIGLFTACAYPLSCNIRLNAPPLLRYLPLTLLLPVGLCATFLRRERSRVLRAAVVSIFTLWGAVNLADNARVVRQALADPPGSEHRILADYLVGHQIRYARAIYWDAYVLDFLSRERVIVSSVDITRIPDYEKLVDAHASAAVNLQRLPCDGPVKVASWCITR